MRHFQGCISYFTGFLSENRTEKSLLRTASDFDWSKVRPEIFGTIFEHSLGKEQRHAQGHAAAAAAAMANLDIIESEGLLAHATQTGAWLAAAIEGLGLPQVDHVRGRGLLRGVVLTEPISARVAAAALDAREFALAREALAKALRQAPTERVCLMIADNVAPCLIAGPWAGEQARSN